MHAAGITCSPVGRRSAPSASTPGALGKQQPDGAPSDVLIRTCNDLLEASIPARHKHASTALAVDWTDVETSARPPRHGTTACAGPEASREAPHQQPARPNGELFFGYYLSADTMMREERGPMSPAPRSRARFAARSAQPP